DSPVWPFGTHLIDIGAAAFLLHLTEGSSSPCFMFFTFTLISSGLRWDWRGASLTTLMLLLLFAVVDTDHDSETLLHGPYLLVVGLLVAYFSGLRAYNRERLDKLATWPILETALTPNFPLNGLLVHVAEVTGAPRILVIWDESQKAKRH